MGLAELPSRPGSASAMGLGVAVSAGVGLGDELGVAVLDAVGVRNPGTLCARLELPLLSPQASPSEGSAPPAARVLGSPRPLAEPWQPAPHPRRPTPENRKPSERPTLPTLSPAVRQGPSQPAACPSPAARNLDRRQD